MFIVSGQKAKALATVSVNERCSSCGHTSLLAIVVQPYSHLFWIPTFPVRKKLFLSCPNCQKMISQKEMDPLLLERLQPVKAPVATPLWMWTGTFLIVVLLGWAFLAPHAPRTGVS